ncbi:MAG TPA: DUF2285 domain-containing protein [Hyphomicrobiaceae bacterium]|jgi:hypothetical protein|nr:DUF2285 domain-containing protein [Hyphomicrobiaceae bacterium]
MRGRSATFADPSLTALQARHVWLPDACASTLLGVAEPTYASSKRRERIFLPSLPSLEHILIDASGQQHVVLRANQASIQLSIEGGDLTTRPVAITFLVPGFDALAEVRNQLDLLDRVFSANRAPSVVPRWTTRTRNLRDALITLDGRCGGVGNKEIAICIYGAEDVAADWDAGLRQRMQRHYSRAEALAAGGYRAFLR